MTVEDFWEVEASGRRYSRAYVLDELEKRDEGFRSDLRLQERVHGQVALPLQPDTLQPETTATREGHSQRNP